MERRSLEAIVQALDAARVRYLIVGGLAVTAHGHVRFVADVDLVFDPDPAALARAVAALSSLGYVPRAPVPFADFADPAKRACWVCEQGHTVFPVHSPQHPATDLSLFVEVPFDFESVYARAARFGLSPDLEATFVDLRDLIAMKRRAGRPQDLLDVEALESLRRARADEE